MNKKNILLISSRADLSGGPKALYDQAEFFLKNNYDKQINIYIASPLNQYFSTIFQSMGSGFIDIPIRSFRPVSFIKLAIFCNRHKIDIIHSHGRGAGYYSRLLKFITRVSVIHTFHGCHRASTISDQIKNKIDFFFKFFTNQFISVSEAEYKVAQELNLMNPKRTIIIPNGISLESFKSPNKDELENMKKLWNHQENDIVLGSITRLDPHKGNDLLISHFSKLLESDQRQNYKLVLAGEGIQLAAIEKLILELNLKGKVFLIGQITNTNDFLHAINTYVSASKSEGLPISVIEALATKTNCVLSNVSGHQDLVDSEHLFNRNDPTDFINKIQKTNFQQNHPIENYDIKNICDKIWQIYKTIKKE